MSKHEKIETNLNITSQKKTTFAGDVGKLASGTILAQAIAVLAAPFLTRLYAPEAFGILALFVSITGILTVISCMRYELSIMLPKSDKEAANLLAASLIFVTIISILTIFVIWWGRNFVVQLLNAPKILLYLWLVPLAVFIGGVFSAFSYWSSRMKNFGRLAVVNITSSVITISGKLGFGYVGHATGGTMITASLVGKALASTILGGKIWKDNKKLFYSSIHWKEMLSGIKRHRKFPMYSTGSALLNTASWQLPAILLASFFSPVIVGFYALGHKVLKMPMNLIGRSIGKVFFQRAAEAKAKGELAPLVENVFRKLVMMGLFPFLMLTIIGKDLFVVVFGANWAEAGVFVQILSIFIFVQFIATPLGHLYNVLEKQEFGLKINIVILISRLFSLCLGGYLGSVIWAFMLFSVTGVLIYGYYGYYVLSSAGVGSSEMVDIILKELLLFLPFGIIQITAIMISPNSWWRLLVSFVLLVFYIFLLMKKNTGLFNWVKYCFIKIVRK
jgi:O-antigen/teichoic acid export membrane protein